MVSKICIRENGNLKGIVFIENIRHPVTYNIFDAFKNYYEIYIKDNYDMTLVQYVRIHLKNRY